MEPRTDRLSHYRYPEDAVSEPQAISGPRRKLTVFEAVAGKAGYQSHLPTSRRNVSKHRDTQTNSLLSVPPEEVLFRRQGAPERYEESDIYFSSSTAEQLNLLPDSDLLKYIHRYASLFYKNNTSNAGKSDFGSLDETALLAMGILLEETLALKLGTTGDLPFVEGESEDEMTGKKTYWNGREWVRSVVEKRSVGQPQTQGTRAREP